MASSAANPNDSNSLAGASRRQWLAFLHTILFAKEENVIVNSFCTASHSAWERSGHRDQDQLRRDLLATRSKISITSRSASPAEIGKMTRMLVVRSILTPCF